MNHLAGSKPHRLRVEMMSLAGNLWTSAEYASFTLDTEANSYAIHLSGYVGDAGDAFNSAGQTVNGTKFSTFDVNNNAGTSNCAAVMQYGWWFSSGCSVYGAGTSPNQSSGLVWSTDPNQVQAVVRMMLWF